jgi:hypothetical protein
MAGSRRACILIVLSVMAATCRPAVSAAEPPSGPDRIREALSRATAAMRGISTEGGYLWWYSPDLQERWGEGKATATQIWIQPPGTPSMGMAFLRAHAATGDDLHFEAAQAAAMALVRGQLESGGWDYRIDFDPRQMARSYRRADVGTVAPAEAQKRRNTSTFDDDNTQSAIRFLMAFVQAAGQRDDVQLREIREAMEYALRKMAEAQYPNGAWPQRYAAPADPARHPVRPARIPEQYPREHPKTSYAGHYTLNDHTQRDCILTMLDAWRRFGRPEHLACARRGGDFLILAQLPAPQSSWAQQYNTAMEPAWARAFEPPAVCSAESVGVIRTLIELYVETGDEKYLAPIPPAIDWFRRSEIRPGVWARLYELGTNRPIYGDRDGLIHYTLEELSEERRTGYSWQAGYGVQAVIAQYEQLRRSGRDGYRQLLSARAPATGARLQSLAAEAQGIVGAMDDQDRWLRNGRIETRTFIQNVGVLCGYLEALR